MPGQAYVALSRLRSLEGLFCFLHYERNFKRSDVMDYALNKEELLKNSLHFETKFYS
jgi:hypothetical protein